ncbi:ATP-binding cassette domain-containing protein [Marinomonas agarivorans]|nr:ATP-binding cassette domain-containing protein [Marinomonas agarivorans]
MLDIDLHYSWQQKGGVHTNVFRSHYKAHIGEGLTSILGKSGEGKSTLLTLLGGFVQGRGSIQYYGRELIKLAPDERPVTNLFQQDNLFPQLTVWQNIAIGLSNSLRLTDAQMQTVNWALERTKLTAYANSKPDELSGGQAQRVAIARAISRAAVGDSSSKKSILLLDEPFSALDPKLRMDMMLLVKELTQQLSLTTLLVSHFPDEVKTIGGQFLLIEGGSVVLQDSVELLSAENIPVALHTYLK